MIKAGGLVMGVVMGAVSAGTYYGLDLLPPGSIPPPLGRVVAPEEPAAPAPEPAPPMAVAAAPAPAPAAEVPVTEQDLAEEPPPPAPAPASVADEPEAAPESAAAAPDPEPAPAPAPAPAAEPAPKPAPAPEPAESVAKAESASPPPASAPAARKAPEADVIKPWWPDPATMPETQLKLKYAGQVQGQPALALLFSAALKLDTLKQHATILGATGEAVAGEWTLGKNPALAVFSGLAPGRYTVILQPPIADQKGYMLGATLKGPVYIKEP